ncbi:MAG: histidine phosphatase family protein [Acidimicrobiales bacterium]
MTAPDAVVYLVRHGRTALNAAGVLRGRLDPPLDEFGEAEAARLATTLASAGLAAVETSPLGRAHQTAAAIAGAAGVPLEVDDRLIDRDYGQWAGAPAGDLVARFGSVDAAPGVEGREALTKRAVLALTDSANRWAPLPVAFVAHDAVNRAVLSFLVPSVGEPDGIPQRTGCWNRLDRNSGHWSAPIVDARPDDDPR